MSERQRLANHVLSIDESCSAPASFKDRFSRCGDLMVFTIASVGTVVHFLSTLQQLIAGRWRFDLRGKGRGSSNLIRGGSSNVIRGVYESSAHAPETVLARWRMLHELLPSATARVPLDAFVQVHKSIRAPEP